MRYIGSKSSLLPFIKEKINSLVDKDCKVFCDLFAGTASVGRSFKEDNYQIIANDIQYYSYVLNKHYIGNNREVDFSKISSFYDIENSPYEVCDFLSNVPLQKGFIYNNYCQGGTINAENQRMYFSNYNGQLCDAIRLKIEEWKNKELIEENEYFFLLTALLETIDKRANTTAIYGAFLKNLKKSALQKLRISPVKTYLSDNKHYIFNKNANELIREVGGDILYLDPPYNHRQYYSNYHLLETIAKYDYPEIKGKTGLRKSTKEKSLYCSKRDAKNAFKDLVKNANFKYIFLSYNNEGILTYEDIKEILSAKGDFGYFLKEYKRYKADSQRFNKSKTTKEYLYYVRCK